MNFTEQQLTRYAQNWSERKNGLRRSKLCLETHEAMGAEPDSRDVQELKERLKTARMQLAAMR
jgi:hypothetical protein